VAIALLFPAAYAEAGKHKTSGPDTPLRLELDGASGFSGDGSNIYVDNTDCNVTICVRVKLISGGKTIAFDTRNTLRSVTVSGDLAQCLVAECPVLADFGQLQGLLEVHIPDRVAKFWFNAAGVDWRIDWRSVSVDTSTPGVWVVTSDDSRAELSQLNGKRTRPRETFTGIYTVPLILDATEQ